MAVGDVYKLTLVQQYLGMLVQNTHYFDRKTAGDPTVADAQVLADYFKDAFKAQQNAAISYYSWTLQQMRGGTVTAIASECRRTGGILYQGIFTGTLVGSLAGESLPPQSAMVTTLNTGLAGKRRRGRMYLAGKGEAEQSGGTWLVGTTTAMAAVWSTVIAAYGTAGTEPNWRLGVWSERTATGCVPAETRPHTPTNVNPPDLANAYAPITSAQVKSIVYSQRRRTLGVGR
jgi:hypothetical protein